MPFIKTEQRVFNDSLMIEIDVVRISAMQKQIETTLYYQIDGQKWQQSSSLQIQY